jgi:putative transcriptional regulator
MAIVKYERAAPYKLKPDERAALLALTDDEIDAAAEGDPDAQPLNESELFRLNVARLAKAVRAKAGLSQSKFADVYKIKAARLRDLEQGRVEPDSVVVAYLTMINADPERARIILEDVPVSA